MKTLLVLFGALVCGLAVADAGQCKFGFWGDSCQHTCGYCGNFEGRRVTCEKSNGTCPDGPCTTGWEGPKCTTPKCYVVDENGKETDVSMCLNGSECVAPDTCFCGDNINHVGPTCFDLRLRGLIGSGICICVLILALTFCTYGSKIYRRRHEKST